MLPISLRTLLLLCICSLHAPQLRAGTEEEALADRIMADADSLVRARLAALDDGMMEHRFDKVVRRRIVNYLERWPHATARLLSRSARYFPIFERQLAAAGMPLELRYVTIQESALRPYAISHASAGGLWQLMPGTARELGLTVDEVVDERFDPELGCAAGLEYLRHQYERYGDWTLALAAYNCGPGNLNRAIRRSGRSEPTYWQIRRFLPRETRNYLPNIIAAVYILTYYHAYDVAPEPMELDMQITEAMTVYRPLSLHRVAQVTGLKPDRVVELNPQYLKGHLPGRPGGHRLRLPRRVMPAMRTYLAAFPEGVEECDLPLPWASPRLHAGEGKPDGYYDQYHPAIAPTDTTLWQIAARTGQQIDQLAVWSRAGAMDTLAHDAHLVYYDVREYQPLDPRRRDTPEPAPAIANGPVAPVRLPGIGRKVEAEVRPTVPQRASLVDRLRSLFD